MSKRILIFSLAYYPVVGGAEIAVKEITDRLARGRSTAEGISDIEFDMVTLRFSKIYQKKERIGNCTIYRINGGPRLWRDKPGYLSKVLFVSHAALFALKLNQKNKYDAFWAIMTNMLFPIVLMRFLGNKTPYILTLQDGDPFVYVFKRLRIRVFLPLLKYGFRHADKIQAISNFLAGWARQMMYRGTIEIIPNGVDVNKFSIFNFQFPKKINQTTLITTSRLVEKNGIGDLIEAMKFLPENVHLKILGAGPLEDNLKFKIKNLKLENRVQLQGFVKPADIPLHLHNADIFIRPSLSEGMGSSFIEAMAARLPVIATPVGGIVDFLHDNETGLFCEVNNPKSIADKVMEYTNNPELASRIIENAQKLVKEKYDWNFIANEMKTRVFDKV